MNDDKPAGEVRPIIDREPRNAPRIWNASARTRFCTASWAGSSPRRLASCGETTHDRRSGAKCRLKGRSGANDAWRSGDPVGANPPEMPGGTGSCAWAGRSSPPSILGRGDYLTQASTF
jgi:hypothetical protein